MKKDIDIILVRPESSWNTGSVARAASNFGCSSLKIVDPAHHDPDEVRQKACQAPLANSIEQYDTIQEAVCDNVSVVGFTARKSRHRTSHLSLSELCNEELNEPVAFCFGPERTGLENSELNHCTHLVYIPTDPAFPSMNLSHAVAVALYAFRESGSSISASDEVAPVSSWDACLTLVDELIEATGADATPPHVPGILKRVLKRTAVNQYELSLLLSFLRNIERTIRSGRNSY